MANEIALFGNKASLPAHVAAFFSDESNIADRVTVPTLSYEGKVWAVRVDGTKTRLMRRNADGDEEPVSVMRVVILDYAKRRGRTYYPGAYDPNKIAMPTCWSDDGIAPDASVQEPQARKCDGCPRAVKGDRITDQGVASASCSMHRMVAVVPANRQDFQVLRMKLATTSLWDKQSEDLIAQNWLAFDNYIDFLRSNNVQHTAALVTKMRFNPNVAYPRVLFSPDRWLTTEELAAITPRAKTPEVAKLLGGTWTPAGADGTLVADTAKPSVAAETAGYYEMVQATIDDTPVETEEPKPVKAKAPKAKAPPKIEDDDDEGAMEILLPKKPLNPPPAVSLAPKTKPAVTTGISPDIDAILRDFDED